MLFGALLIELEAVSYRGEAEKGSRGIGKVLRAPVIAHNKGSCESPAARPLRPPIHRCSVVKHWVTLNHGGRRQSLGYLWGD